MNQTATPDFGTLNNPTGWYRFYCTSIIFMVLVLAYVDRGILGVVLEPLKAEFDLTDTQLGYLTGPAFAIFYAVLGIPLARWSDVGNRRVVISLCLAIWSAMTAAAGLVNSYLMLFLTRVGVGIGEAGAAPPTHSLASNYYPPEKHGRTASILSLATLVGSFLGVIVGGIILKATGSWRVTLMAVGLPGIALAVVTFFTLREPREKTRVPGPSEIFDAESRGIVAGLVKMKTYFQLLLTFSIISFFTLGMPNFLVPFFQRSFELEVDVATRMYGGAALVSTLLGTILAGVVIDRMAKRDVAWKLRLPGILCLLATPIMIAALLAQDAKQCALLYLVANTFVFMSLPALFSAVYGVAVESQRAMAVAILGLVTNLIGLGLGPVLIGALSDYLNPQYGVDSLRYAMAATVIFLAWAAVHMLLGSRTFKADFEAAQAADAAAKVA